MSFRKPWLLVCFGLALLIAAPTDAAPIVLNEDFTHPDGNLVGQTPTPGPGTAWSNHSGTGTFIQVASGAAVLTQGGGSREDAGTNFTSQDHGVVTATFDLKVNDDAPITGDPSATGGTGPQYFAHFMQEFNFNFLARTFIVPPNDPNSGDYTIGLGTNSGAFEVKLPTDFNFGDTVGVEITFSFPLGTASLTAGSNTVLSADVSLGETLDRFALRQADSASDETIMVDNLVVTGLPEPASFMLMLTGLTGVFLRRRL